MKKFDIEKFNQNKDHLNSYNYTSDDNYIISQSDDEYEYYETVKHKDSLFQTINRYYKSGQLKMTVKDFPNNFLAGIMKEYDEQGNLVKETDYDAPYKFTWEDILKLIKDRKLDMTGNNFEVGRNIVDKRPVWSIIFNIKNSDKLGVIGIYGDTGEIFQESEMDAPADGDYDDE